MTRYYVADTTQIVAVADALNLANGHGAYASEPHRLVDVRTGRVLVTFAPGELPESSVGTIISADDGTKALELPDAHAFVDRHLGKLIGGATLPRARDLVQVDRPRDNSKLPDPLRDKLDDDYVAAALDGAGDENAARQAIAAELGARATAALARADTKRGQKIIDKLMGKRP